MTRKALTTRSSPFGPISPNGAHVTMKNEIAISQEWLWVDNPPYQSFEDVMFGYTIPRDFYSGAGASYCGYPFGGLYLIGGLP